MKKALTLAIATLALTGLLLATATTAMATPTKARSCSNCHRRNTAIVVSVTKVSSTSTAVTYKVRVTGGSGSKVAWAVLSGGKNVARRRASTGTFTIGVGKTFRVWAYKGGRSDYRATITAKR